MNDHCWHSMPGFVFGNGARRYVCCRCGMKASGTINVVQLRPLGHGPHAPAEVTTFIVPPDAVAGGACAPGAIEGAA